MKKTGSKKSRDTVPLKGLKLTVIFCHLLKKHWLEDEKFLVEKIRNPLMKLKMFFCQFPNPWALGCKG